MAIACAGPPAPPAEARPAAVAQGKTGLSASDVAFLDDLEQRTFRWFWEKTNPKNGLVPDREPTPSFSSVAAVGFGLAAYPIGVERGWVTREAARERVLTTLRFLRDAPAGEAAAGAAGTRGFLYHFLDMETGRRFEKVELSTIDTALCLAGALFCESYFDGANPAEAEVRALAEELFRRADWAWASTPRPPRISMGWTPEEGFHTYDWKGYNEAMIVYVLALGSPTHPVGAEAWPAYTSTYRWETFQGQTFLNFAPLFGHQFSHVFLDLEGIRDAYMRGKGIDYFENSRRATLAQRAYAIANPGGFAGYGPDVWGLTACDGPADVTLDVDGRRVRFFSYAARGAGAGDVRDDGTLAPAAAAASLPFTPELSVKALRTMVSRWGDELYGAYGFRDAFNPTFTFSAALKHGRVVAGKGWFDVDALGIDQGPILAMIENHRSGLVWKTMRKNPGVVRGLVRAGFTGGWLAEASPRAAP
ncbi:MAG TPA: glucoamylase family protein [Thermoanaerobaculia bacterium]|nr:glucoamylase family protein [Thermoanaerobaculia bacterium]